MVVAASTGNRDTQHDAGRHINLLIDQVRSKLPWIGFVKRLGTHGKKTGSHQILSPLVIGSNRQQVTCDLFLHKSIVRLVFIKRIDDVVSVSPGVRIRSVQFLASRLGIPGNVQPVPPPAFTETLVIQQSIDRRRHRRVRIGFPGCYEFVNLFGSRWQADQVET